MTCRKMRKLISPYVDKALSERERQAFAAHIEGCTACRKALAETEAVHQIFASAERSSAPSGFVTRVMARVEENDSAGFRSIFSFKPLLLRFAETALALVLVVIGLLSGHLLMSDKATFSPGAEVRDSFHLDIFEAIPAQSVGGIYVSMTEAGQ